MADLDSLIVTFQTQLSDVMETVVKTAMYEVTRLVEDGFLEEVKRRDQEVESLRVQLQWAERKLSDHGGKDRLEMTGMCVERVGDEVELSSELAGERPEGHQEDIFRGCGLKAEGERWTRSLRQGATPRSDGPVAAHSPESQATAEEDTLAAVDVKEEEGDKPSCSSVRLGGWSGEARPESQSNTDLTEAQPGQTQESSEELLRNIIKQDPQLTAAYVFPEEQEETHMAKDLPLEEDSGWVGLTATTAGVLLATETDCDPAQTRGSARQTEHELSSITADVSALVAAGREQISSSASPKVRLQNSDALNVTIKQEVITDSDRCEKNTYKDKKVTKSGVASFSSSVKQHRMSSETLKQNRISHKAAVQEVMKLHSKVGAGLRLQADIQHLHRPMKRFSQALANSATTAQSIAHSQVVNLNPLNRVPSTSKATAPPLSAQRLHLGDKQATAHSRSGAPWVSIKTQLHSANSHHASPLPHPDSHAHAGPRHLLRCGQCGKCFPHPSNLKAHLQTHTGERPFCCSLCGRSFTKLSNLKAHRRVHTGERPYCCLACGKRFTQKCNLKRHQRIHLDV